jgi:hypothetical protein
MIESPSTIISDPWLTSLNSVAYHSLPTKCAPWFASIIEPCWATFEQVPYMVSVHLQAMLFWSRTWLCASISIYCPSEYRLRSCRWSTPFGSSYLDRGCRPWHWDLRRFFLLSELPLELWNQEDRVMKHNPILHGEMSPTHWRESYLRDQEVFLLSTIPILNILPTIRSMHHSSFLVLPLLS